MKAPIGHCCIFVFIGALMLSCVPVGDRTGRAAAAPLEVGIFYPGARSNLSGLTALEEQLGSTFETASWYQDWSEDIDLAAASRLHQHGAIPAYVWQPQLGDQPVLYQDVLDGRYDAYLDRTAAAVAGLGFPIRIDLAPEMNTNWVPWGWGTAANDRPGLEQDFWRYVVGRFRAAGAGNAQWVWAPNVHFKGEKYSFADFYPGDGYVDYVGLDGYNWGASRPDGTWQSFSQVFGGSYADLTALTGKPVLLTEVASSDAGGDKAAWIKRMWQDLPVLFPQVAGINWFDMDKEADWRIEADPAVLAAFQAGLPLKPVPAPVAAVPVGVGNVPPASPTDWTVLVPQTVSEQLQLALPLVVVPVLPAAKAAVSGPAAQRAVKTQAGPTAPDRVATKKPPDPGPAVLASPITGCSVLSAVLSLDEAYGAGPLLG